MFVGGGGEIFVVTNIYINVTESPVHVVIVISTNPKTPYVYPCMQNNTVTKCRVRNTNIFSQCVRSTPLMS
jgi:hypothetical protein